MAAAAASSSRESANRPKTYRRCPTSEPARSIGSVTRCNVVDHRDKVQAAAERSLAQSRSAATKVSKPTGPDQAAPSEKRLSLRTWKAGNVSAVHQVTAQAALTDGGHGLPIPVIRQGTPAMQTGTSAPTDNPIPKAVHRRNRDAAARGYAAQLRPPNRRQVRKTPAGFFVRVIVAPARVLDAFSNRAARRTKLSALHRPAPRQKVH